MARLFALIVAAIVIYALLKRQRSQARRPVEETKVLSSKPVVACARCGVFVPQDEVIASDDGLVFCSEAHRRGDHAHSR
jgi:hypothetical protein